MAVAEKQWYVVRAISGQEKKIKTYLDKVDSKVSLYSNIREYVAGGWPDRSIVA